ncbi:hypothetical protein [Clostridiisalibacter paucivorans]|uniref:hypothetical protein n=1 Tax=Clostridiisalibacter paucivorans TaxID=408753 RepID=UPI00047AB435|nr:hypothetical protein [Clostridiisalibacter paucivorans]
MAYTIIDIIDKLISIEKKSKQLYITAIKKIEDNSRIKIIFRILLKEEDRHIEYYNNLKKSLEDKAIEPINFYSYDKISHLANKFKNDMYLPNFKDIKDLIIYALDFEKANLALLMDIKGRLVLSKTDTDSIQYKIISQIVEEEKKHVKNLENFIHF